MDSPEAAVPGMHFRTVLPADRSGARLNVRTSAGERLLLQGKPAVCPACSCCIRCPFSKPPENASLIQLEHRPHRGPFFYMARYPLYTAISLWMCQNRNIPGIQKIDQHPVNLPCRSIQPDFRQYITVLLIVSSSPVSTFLPVPVRPGSPFLLPTVMGSVLFPEVSETVPAVCGIHV